MEINIDKNVKGGGNERKKNKKKMRKKKGIRIESLSKMKGKNKEMNER